MSKTILTLPVLGMLLWACTAEKTPGPAPVAQPAAPEFRVGQVWTYLTRPGEEASRILVCKIETVAKYGIVVHIHVEGVSVKDPKLEGGVRGRIGPMPFSLAALRGSVISLESTRDDVPDYEADYATWRVEVEKGAGGLFDIPVSEGVKFAEQTLNQ